jgi:hypothetical protein
MALVAIVTLTAGVVSDAVNGSFWARHALLSGVVASVIVVMLSIAVINEVIERRRRQRWSVLAQYVLFELIRNSRMIWTGVLDVAGLLPAGTDVETARQLVRDSLRLTAHIRELLADDDRRAGLHAEVGFLAEHADEVLSRWAAVMLNGEVYAETIDRHVELAGDVSWIGGLLDASYPPTDGRRQQRARSGPAVQIERDSSHEWLADRIVIITQLAEQLDRGTLELALRVVPVQWWRTRLGTAGPTRNTGMQQ